MTILRDNKIDEQVKNDGVIVSATHIVAPGAMKNMKAYSTSTLYLEGNDIVFLWKCCKNFQPDEEILKIHKVVCTGFQNYVIKDSNLDIVKFSKKMFESRCQGLRSQLIQEIKDELPNMKNWVYDDLMGKMCLKVLEEYKLKNENED
eukprot:gene2721-3917_t